MSKNSLNPGVTACGLPVAPERSLVAEVDAIEITPEMIEAGMDEFYGHPIIADEPTEDEVRKAIIETYRAMALAYRKGQKNQHDPA